MILIIGGAYQGKLKWAIREYDVKDEEIFYCEPGAEIDYNKRVIYGIEEFLRGGISERYFREHIRRFEDKILICTDISQGIVPMDAGNRAWRETVGRTLVYLGSKADKVVRVFCGLPQVIKEDER